MDDRTIPATPTRRQQLAAQGDVAKSDELSSVVAFLALVALASASFKGLLTWFQDYFEDTWQRPWDDFASAAELQSLLGIVLFKLALVFGSALLVGVITNTATGVMQTGHWRFSWSRSNRPSMMKKVSGIFSFDTFAGLLSSIFKLIAISAAVYITTKNDCQNLLTISDASIVNWLMMLSGAVFKCCFAVGVCLLGIGLIDLGWRKFRYESRIRMTSEELREEIRQSGADPHVEAQRRELQNRVLGIGSTGSARDATQKH